MAVMRAGRIIETGDISSVYANPADGYRSVVSGVVFAGRIGRPRFANAQPDLISKKALFKEPLLRMGATMLAKMTSKNQLTLPKA